MKKNQKVKDKSKMFGHTPWNKGKKGFKHSETTKEKIKKNNAKYWLGKQRSAEDIEKFRKAKLGKKTSQETKNKISKIAKEKGYGKWMIGKKHSEETKQKMRDNSQRGIKNINWMGGISKEEYGEDWTETLRESIRQRDNLMCCICGLHQDELTGWHKKLSVHHIDYNKYNLNPDNLITLCVSCHSKTNHNREKWINHFKNI